MNAFAANDPESTLAIWHRLGLGPDPECPVIALVHLRRERAHRGEQFARLVAGPLEADRVLLVGEATDLVEKQALGHGLPRHRLENLGPAEPARGLRSACSRSRRAARSWWAWGNLVGRGDAIARFFENRRVVPCS